MEKIEFSCSYSYSIIRTNRKKKIFSLSCEIDNFLDDEIENSYVSGNYSEYLNSLGILTFRDYANNILNMDYNNFFQDDPDWENAFDDYQGFVTKIITNLIRKFF